MRSRTGLQLEVLLADCLSKKFVAVMCAVACKSDSCSILVDVCFLLSFIVLLPIILYNMFLLKTTWLLYVEQE